MKGYFITLTAVLLMLLSGSFISAVSGSPDEGTYADNGSDPTRSRSGDGSGEIQYSLPDLVGYYDYDYTMRTLYHSNGYRYSVNYDKSDIDQDGIRQDCISIEIDGGNPPVEDEVFVDLGVLEYQDRDFYPYIDAGPDGDIYIVLHGGGTGVLKFEMGEGPRPLDHAVLMDREMDDYLEDVRFHFPGDDILVSFINDDQLRVVDLDPDGEIVIRDDAEDLVIDLPFADNSAMPFDRGCIANRFWIIKQGDKGHVFLSWFDDSLEPLEDVFLLTIPPPVGMDNLFRTAVHEDRIYLFMYLDRLNGNNYDSLNTAIISGDGSILDMKEDLFDGAVRSDGAVPVISESSVCIITHDLLGMFRYDVDLEFMEYVNLSRIFHLDYPLVAVRVYPGDHDVLAITIDIDYNFITLISSSFASGSLPDFGVLFIDDQYLMEGGVMELNGGIYVGEGGDLRLNDVQINFIGDYERLVNGIFSDGNLVMNGCTVNMEILPIMNYGTFSIQDPPTGISVINYGEMTCSGSGFVGNGRPTFDLDGGNASFIGLSFSNEGNPETNTPWITGLNSDNDRVTGLTLTGCSFDDIETLFSGSNMAATIDSCSFRNINRAFSGDGVRVIRNSRFTNVSGINVWSGGEALIENSTFVRSGNIFDYDNDHDPLNLTIRDSVFTECTGIISLFDRSYRSEGIDLLLSGCRINRSTGPLDIPENVDVTVDGCLIEGGDRGIVIESSDGSVRIVNNTFTDLNVSVEIFDTPKDYDSEIFEISYNSFLKDNISIMYRGYHNRIYSSYSLDEEDSHLGIEDLFIDCRYNSWDSRSPSWVAGKITEGCYFLPFYSLDGRLVETSDMDLDMMDDDWERANDLDPDFYYDRFMDHDMDRYSNYEEYRTGTDPNDQGSNPADRMRVVFIMLFTLIIFLPFMVLMIAAFWGHPELRRRKRQRFVDYYVRYSRKRKDYEKKARELELKKSVNDLKMLLSGEGPANGNEDGEKEVTGK